MSHCKIQIRDFVSIENSAFEATNGKFQCNFMTHLMPLMRFGTVGFISGVIYFACMWIVFNFFSKNYVVAVSISYIASVLFHYFANCHFTFGAKTTKMHSQIIRYLIMLIINYLISIAIISMAVKKLELSPYIGALLSILCLTLPGYITSKYWVFKKDLL